MKVRRRNHRLATMLFTDIVGSTQVAGELGDRRWRALLERHHAIVRQELKRFRGKEQDTAGDGFFAAFDEPSDAIRCACAVADRVRELGIELRAGLNLGEAEVIGGKLGGMAVHAAARIMAWAGPGEVLVASTVRDMVPGSGFAFEDRGIRELRDVPGEWRLFAVTDVDGNAREAPLDLRVAAQRREAVKPPPLVQRRSGRIAIGATVLLLGAAAIVVPLANGKPPPPQNVVPKPVDHVLQFDLTSDESLDSIPVGGDPSAIAFGEGSVWVTNSSDGTVSRIDPASRRVATVQVGRKPDAVAVGAGAVWVANDTDGNVSKINPLTNRVVAVVDLGLAVGLHTLEVATDTLTDTVWVSFGSTTIPGPFTVGRVDPSSNTFEKLFRGGGVTSATLSGGEGSIWFASDDGTVVRFDARTGRIAWQSKIGAKPFTASCIGNGSAWLAWGDVSENASGEQGAISGGVIAPIALATNEMGATISVGGGPSGVAVKGVAVYVSDIHGGVIAYVGGAVRPTIPVNGSATGIVVGDGALWVPVNVP